MWFSYVYIWIMIKICFTFISLKSSVIKRHIYKIFTSLFLNEMYQIICMLIKNKIYNIRTCFFPQKKNNSYEKSGFSRMPI